MSSTSKMSGRKVRSNRKQPQCDLCGVHGILRVQGTMHICQHCEDIWDKIMVKK